MCTEQRLDSLVVIAGPKDLSWAASLATCFAEGGCETKVLGVPHSPGPRRAANISLLRSRTYIIYIDIYRHCLLYGYTYMFSMLSVQ